MRVCPLAYMDIEQKSPGGRWKHSAANGFDDSSAGGAGRRPGTRTLGLVWRASACFFFHIARAMDDPSPHLCNQRRRVYSCTLPPPTPHDHHPTTTHTPLDLSDLQVSPELSQVTVLWDGSTMRSRYVPTKRADVAADLVSDSPYHIVLFGS